MQRLPVGSEEDTQIASTLDALHRAGQPLAIELDLNLLARLKLVVNELGVGVVSGEDGKIVGGQANQLGQIEDGIVFTRPKFVVGHGNAQDGPDDLQAVQWLFEHNRCRQLSASLPETGIAVGFMKRLQSRQGLYTEQIDEHLVLGIGDAVLLAQHPEGPVK